MNKVILIFIFFSTTIYSSDYLKLDEYLSKWLKKNDAVLMFNYKTGKILYEYHSYMFSNKIPIGSVFKLVTTFAFLKKYTIEPYSYKYLCNNNLDEKNNLTCWNKKGHGSMNIESAFINSCNKFYYSLNISIEDMMPIIKYLGLNISLNNNTLTDREKRLFLAGNLAVIKSDFYELSSFLSVFANDGKIIDIKTHKNTYSVTELNIIKKIKNMMFNVIEKGTGRNVFFKGYGFSGKTGTAMNEKGQQNGVFIGFTKDKPYAIIVNLYKNIGSTSAMIASDIIYLYSISR